MLEWKKSRCDLVEGLFLLLITSDVKLRSKYTIAPDKCGCAGMLEWEKSRSDLVVGLFLLFITSDVKFGSKYTIAPESNLSIDKCGCAGIL